MAAVATFVWSLLLLSCAFQASDNTHVHEAGRTSTSRTEKSKGIDPVCSNVTSTPLQTFDGIVSQLTRLGGQLQEMIDHNIQLENEALRMRRELRALDLQLTSCSSTASDITDSYQTQLQDKLKKYLNNFDSDTFLILKIIAVTREVHSLQKRIEHTNSTADIEALQSELQGKTDELDMMMRRMNLNHADAPLIAEIVSLQNQIWDLEQEEIRGGEKSPQRNGRILVLQEQLDTKISELQRNNNTASALLSLIFLSSKVAHIQRLFVAFSERSSSGTADYQRQWNEKVDLLKKKISQLNEEENNTQLTREILVLQLEVDQLSDLISNARRLTESRRKELRVILEQERKNLYNIQKVLEEEDYAKAQIVFQIITVMKKLRELQGAEQGQTSSSQANTLQALLETKEGEYAKAQDEIRELQRHLELMRKKCPGHEEIKTKFEENIAELNKTGDPKAALVLIMLNLHNDVKTLRDQILASEDSERISELESQMEEKQGELNSNTEVIKRLFSQSNIILKIIKLLHEDSATNRPALELENEVEGLISKINDEESIKLIFEKVTLNKQLADLQIFQTNQTTQLPNDLEAKNQELQKRIDEMKGKNEKHTSLILKLTDLYNELSHPEKEKPSDSQMSATITKLKQQLRANEKERSYDQAEIRSLQNQLNQTEAQCLRYEQDLKDLHKELDTKLGELESKSDTVSALALQISTLSQQLEDLKRQLQKTESESKIRELQKIINEKTDELAKKEEELKTRSAQPQRILQIITLQTRIEKLAYVAVNSTDYNILKELQDQMNHLIEGIQDENNENTKLMFQMLAQQDEIARLKKQEERQTQAELQKIKDLEHELEDIRNRIQEKTRLLDSKDLRIANLSSQIMELHQQIKPLENKISDLKETYSENHEELQKRLDLAQRQLQDSELRLKDTDAKNFELIKGISELKEKLKRAQGQGSKADERKINELEQKIQTQQREYQKIENTNKELNQEVLELKMCCSVDSECDDLQRQLQQSQRDVDLLHKQLTDKDTKLRQLQQDLQEQANNRHIMEIKIHNLQQQLNEKDARLNQLQEKFEHQTREHQKLQDDNKSLQTEKNKLEHDIQNLLNKLAEWENKVYAELVRMDPNTAHRRVIMDKHNTELTTSLAVQDTADHPGRFDVSLAVLGSTGFSSGRHYWEVSVAGKSCYHIGMASESAERRGTIPFRPSEGYWTILLDRSGQYKAVDRPLVTLQVPTQPLTLGILVDYNKGQISFYDAVARTRLYSFTGQTFSDKVFPFINFCVEDAESQVPIVMGFPESVDWIK